MAAYVQDCVMLFGDSITQSGWEEGGFGAKLAHAYSRKLDVLNRGLSGYNTDWAIPVFEKFFAQEEEQKHAPKPSPQHVPITKFISNLKHLVNLVQSPKSRYHSAETKIILVTPPPVNAIQWSADLASRSPPQELDRLFDTTRQYAEAMKDWAREEEVAVVDMWRGLWDASGRQESNLSKYLSDGLHLNKAGYQIMYEKLLETIEEKYPDLHPENMEYVFPRWDSL